MTMKLTALLMSAGLGERFGGEHPKQFAPLGDRPALIWSAQLFAAHADVGRIAVVVPAGREERTTEMLHEWKIDKTLVVAGGETRQQSVLRGLEAVGQMEGNVVIHDAVRPCMTPALLARVVDALETHEAVVPVVPAVDTLYHLSGDTMDALIDRENVAQVQTPQGFRMALLLEAHRWALAKGLASSDDGSLVFAFGHSVHTVAGERNNIKITFREDVAVAEALLAGRE